MIICSSIFNPQFGFNDIFTLLTLLGAVYLYLRFNRKLTEQETVLRNLDIKEKDRRNQAILTLSIVKKVGLYDYDLIIDNTGDSSASNVIIFSDIDLLNAPDHKTLMFPIPIEPHQALKIQKIHTLYNELSFNVQWEDRSKQENSKDICLKTDESTLSIYRYRLISLFHNVPGEEMNYYEINKELEARDKIAKRIIEDYQQKGEEISDKELEKMLNSL